MDRIGFCMALAAAKLSTGLSSRDISYGMKMHLQHLREFEFGNHNFNLKTVLSYLAAINYHLVLLDEERNAFTVSEYEMLGPYFFKKRTEAQFTMYDLSLELGCSVSAISNFERVISVVHIDIFLALANELGIFPVFIPNE